MFSPATVEKECQPKGDLMIRSFGDKDTAKFASGETVRRFQSFERAAYRKIKYLMAAVTLEDLRSPPGNRLETLSGDRAGQHSIRINDQWRICFIWNDSAAENVEIVDYH